MNTHAASPPSPALLGALRWAARFLVLAWAGFWTWFNVASLLGDASELGVGAWLNHGLPAALILAATGLALVRPRGGAVALLLLAAAMGVVFRGAAPLVLALLLGPPVLGGLLLWGTSPTRPRPTRAP